MQRKRQKTGRVDATVPEEILIKIDWLVDEYKWPSRSWAISRLLQEALEKHPDPQQPELPL